MVEVCLRERVRGNAADVLSYLQQRLLRAAKGGLLSDDLTNQTSSSTAASSSLLSAIGVVSKI